MTTIKYKNDTYKLNDIATEVIIDTEDKEDFYKYKTGGMTEVFIRVGNKFVSYPMSGEGETIQLSEDDDITHAIPFSKENVSKIVDYIKSQNLFSEYNNEDYKFIAVVSKIIKYEVKLIEIEI